MVTVTIRCQHCDSKNLVRNGHTSHGKQRYRCKSCKKQSRENTAINGYTEESREEIIKSYQERSSLRGLTRIFGVSRNTVKDWLKKLELHCLLVETPLFSEFKESDQRNID